MSSESDRLCRDDPTALSPTDRCSSLLLVTAGAIWVVMFAEIGSEGFGEVRRLFEGPKQYLPVLSIVDGVYPGRVFVDNLDHPSAAVVWALGRWGYIEAVSGEENLRDELVRLIERVVVPDSLRLGMNWFELYAANSPDWISRLDDWLRVLGGERHLESVYVWDREQYRRFRSGYAAPGGTELEIAEVPILPERVRQAPSVSEDIRSLTAVGCLAKGGNKIAARCVSNGFAAGAEFMIDIETFEPAERGKGYATAAAVGLLDYCLERGLIPVWETTEDNEPSRRLARKLGFVEVESYPVYAVEF